MSESFPSNSKNPPQGLPGAAPRQRQPAVITDVRVRNQGWFFRANSRSHEILRDIFADVIKPYFTDMFADSGYRAVDLLAYRDGAPRRPSSPRAPGRGRGGHGHQQQVTPAGWVVNDYNGQYNGGGAPSPPSYDPRSRPFDFSIYVFEDYAAGRELIDRLRHIVVGYHRATVNDLYDLFNKTGTPDHTGENWGWDTLEEIDNAVIRRARGGGYYLDIVDAHPIKG